ncbi:MAG: S41 family peptidase [Acidobacteriaceae bacterium]
MPKYLKISILAVSVALVLFIFAGGMGLNGVHAAAFGNDDQGAYKQMMVYSEVLKRIQSDYVVEPNIPRVTDGALRGLLESLDEDSSYFTPSDFKEYQSLQNEDKAQVGMVVSKRYGYATVVSVLPGGPADKANINDGDIIEAIGGKSTRQIPLALLRRLLEGKAGTTVTFSVVRPRSVDPAQVTLTRVMPQYPMVEDQQYDGNSILYLKPATIDHDRVQEIESKLKAMQKNGNKKILLDLRDVATGDMPDAIRLANLFLNTGTITTLEGQKVPKQVFTAEAGKAVNTTAPLVVLVNHGTFGAAEVVAAAILDNKRGDLVGDRTFGEGAEQKLIDLPDGAALLLTVAKYETPNGKILQDDAVTPNVQVVSTQFEDEFNAPSAKAGTAAKPSMTTDDQLQKALDMLKQKTA